MEYKMLEYEKKSENLFLQVEELKLEIANLVAEKKQKELLFANMVHEIRTPIGAILGLSEIILASSLDLKQREYVKDIKSSGNLLSSLVNDLLDFSKLEAGKVAINNQNFELKDMIQNIMSVLDVKIKEKNLNFVLDIDNNVSKIIYSDSLRISQILINLINNAIKFTNKGSITLQIKKVFRNSEKEILEFRVIDTGIGLKKSQTHKIFESFIQADQSISSKYGGTGLGLFICQKLVECMDGEIRVESIFNKGSQFIFTITSLILENENKEEDFIKKTHIHLKERLKERLALVKNRQILLVEDNVVSQLIVDSLLKNTDIKLIVAQTGEDGLEIMQNIGEEIDLILMDIRLPQISGYALTKRLRIEDRFKNIPIVSFSANREEDHKYIAKQSGMNAMLTKPLDIIEFYKVLLKYLK